MHVALLRKLSSEYTLSKVYNGERSHLRSTSVVKTLE